MRTKQKLTAAGAIALATTAVLGGAVVTSHAMSNGETPIKGTVTVVAMTSETNGAIKCVYDDIDLPAAPIGIGSGTGTQVDATTGHGPLINVFDGAGPVDENGDPVAGAVMVSSGSTALPDGVAPGDAPTFTVHGSIGTESSSAGTIEVVSDGGSLPPLPDGATVLNADNARPGTAEECAALKPTTTSGVPPSIP